MVENNSFDGTLGANMHYTSKVTKDLVVMGTEDMDAYNKVVQEPGRSAQLIGTHSDAFHCDEVLATTMLLYTTKYANSIIIRTRVQEVLNTLDIVADVGAIYDHEKARYDHHQETFTDVWDDSKDKYKITALSSAGLIYKHYGKEVIQNICTKVFGRTEPLSEQTLHDVYRGLYDKLILEVDAIDNGVSEAEDMKYQITTGLGSRVGRLNLPWNAPKEMTQHAQFKKALKLAEEELLWKLYGMVEISLPAK